MWHKHFFKSFSQTYYIVIKQNWSGTGFANNTITFSLKEYQQGYTAENPFDYTLGSEVSTDFTNGANNYYQFTIEEAGTYKLSLVSLADSNNKTVKLFNINDLTFPDKKHGIYCVFSSPGIYNLLGNPKCPSVVSSEYS